MFKFIKYQNNAGKMGNPTYTLVNPHNGNLAFRVLCFSDNMLYDHVQRHNYYSVIWITKGSGTAKVDFAGYELAAGQMYFLAPYQPFMFEPSEGFEGIALNFHSDFFCIYNHAKEVDCHGVLFHNVYEPPLLSIPASYTEKFSELCEQMKHEIRTVDRGQNDMLVSLLKIWLVYCTRIKAEDCHCEVVTPENSKELQILQELRDAIEIHYRSKHTASDYAVMLNITLKALGKIVKKHFNKTLTNLISERIITEAKRELYLTPKPVKEIAYELGFEDEYYFSRFFKNNADVSPKMYRETVLPYQYATLVSK